MSDTVQIMIWVNQREMQYLLPTKNYTSTYGNDAKYVFMDIPADTKVSDIPTVVKATALIQNIALPIP